MGQIFDRIGRIAKAKFSDTKENFAGLNLDMNNEDDDLKKAIDELSKSGARKNDKKDDGKSEENFDSSQKMDIFLASKILEVSTNATFEEVKVAYKKKIKEYHPDKVATLGKELQDLAAKKTSAINAAYNFFRQKYSK